MTPVSADAAFCVVEIRPRHDAVRDAGVVSIFTIYADWRPVAEAPDALLGALADALLVTDPGRCVWVDERKPGMVQLSFDIEGSGYEDAIAQARQLLDEVIPANGMPGALAEVTAMTDEGQMVWTAE